MSQSERQSELFAGNDWTAIYKAFTTINFNSYDFDTIRNAMVSYIQLNYPEQYNDWVVQSEFIAILDLVSYLGQSLAFRVDLNARENFIDTARKRDSILRLSQFLSYNPRRNLPASGLLKLTGVMTTESLTDSNGNSLNNTKVSWADSSNDNWYDQFITILNSAFVNTNPFGVYLDQKTINDVTSQLYRVNSVYNNTGQYSFTSTVSNASMNFEVVNMELDDDLGYVEVEPNPVTKFQLSYLNDGNGNTSDKTGFFSLFKQGSMNYSDYYIGNSIANNSIEIDVDNINDSDVWVQTVSDNGYIETNGLWTKIGYVPTDDVTKIISNGENITYNSSLSTTQRIYQVVTLANDNILIRFGDGNYGQIPTGNIRVWYRTSNGLSYYIKPSEINGISIKINYYDSYEKTQTLTLYYSLQDTVTNASVTQSDDEIKRIASRMYSTQGRMVSGSDYNTMPQSIGNALKVKATNRYYSGQSRFIDMNDPTGQYQNTITFADDGAFYKENKLEYITAPISGITTSEIIYDYVIPTFQNTALTQFILNEWVTNTSYPFTYSDNSVIWNRSKNYTSTGMFKDSSGNPISVGSTVNNRVPVEYMSTGSILKLKDSSNNEYWVYVESIYGDGSEYYSNTTKGPIVLNDTIPDGCYLVNVYPTFSDDLSSASLTNLENYIGNGKSFGIGYDYDLEDYYFIDNTNLNYTGEYDYSTKGSTSDSSWLEKIEYTPFGWKIYTRSLYYIFESEYAVKFYFINDTSVVNPRTGETTTDKISVLKYNSNSFKSDISFDIDSNYTYPDGYQEPRRVKVTFEKDRSSGTITDLDIFSKILSINNDGYVFHKLTTDSNGNQYYILTDDVVLAPNTGSVVYTPGRTIDNGVFTTTDPSTYNVSDYVANYGVKNLSFKWNHVAAAEQRIDPAVSNVIDIFILTSGYYTEMKDWRGSGYDTSSIPVKPTEVDIELDFSGIEDYKMFSDEIVWRPASFKLIGGSTASADVRFNVVVVPLQGTQLSNGEIKANMINVINTYFDVTNWDFGETFYASELIGYIHQEMINSISSVVIVPTGNNQIFGNLFQIQAGADELFFPTLTVDNISIVNSLTSSVLGIS